MLMDLHQLILESFVLIKKRSYRVLFSRFKKYCRKLVRLKWNKLYSHNFLLYLSNINVVFKDIDFTGKNALICGRSKHVGLPIAMLLHSNFKNAGNWFHWRIIFGLKNSIKCKSYFFFISVKGFNANTIICHRFTPVDQLTKFCQNADVVITATGL